MKILKAFLLIFIISFAASTVSAQCDDFPIKMIIVPLTTSTFDVTVLSLAKDRRLVIDVEGPIGDIVAEHPVAELRTIVSFNEDDYSPGTYLISCGMKREGSLEGCVEGCTVDVDF